MRFIMTTIETLAQKQPPLRTVAVHAGTFHADDVFAIGILKLINSALSVIRTMDGPTLRWADGRVDIGKNYNPLTHDYDHHQKGGAGERENGVPYASAGLVWKHFGERLVHSKEAFDTIDRKLIQSIDAKDNGMTTSEDTICRTYTIYDMVKIYNKAWEAKLKTNDEAFFSAVDVAKDILRYEIIKADESAQVNDYVRSCLPSHSHVPYVVLDKDCDWQPVLVNETDKLYAIYPSPVDDWRVRAVPIVEEGFIPRKSFPAAWGGLAGDDLSKATGVEDMIFCHKNLHLTTTKTKERALRIVEIAIAYSG